MTREAYRTARKLLLRALSWSDRAALLGRSRRPAARRPAGGIGRDGDGSLEGREEGNRKIEAWALTALAELALFTRADPKAAKELVSRALEILPDDAPLDACRRVQHAHRVRRWVGDVETAQKYLQHIVEAAHAADRKDLEASAVLGGSAPDMERLDPDEARPLIGRALELAVESGMSCRARTRSSRRTLNA